MQSNKCEFHACERIQATSEGMSRFRVWHTYWRCFSFNACDYAAIRQKYSMPTWDGMCAFKFCSKCTRSCYCKTTLAQKEMREAKNSICRRGGQKIGARSRVCEGFTTFFTSSRQKEHVLWLEISDMFIRIYGNSLFNEVRSRNEENQHRHERTRTRGRLFLGSFAGFTQMIPTLLHDGARRAWSHGHVHVAG